MSFFDTQNPGIGGIDELTPAEEAFLTTLAGITGSENEVLTWKSGAPSWEAPGSIPQTTELTYTGNKITRIDKADGSYKTITYTGNKVNTIYSSASNKTKTFVYSGNQITDIIVT